MEIKTRIWFGESLKTFFEGGRFVKILLEAKMAVKTDGTLNDIVYNRYHVLSFTKDRKYLKVKFDVNINHDLGEFVFLISLSDQLMKGNIELNRGLCLIKHPDFSPNIIYSIECAYDDTEKTLILKKIKGK